MAAKKPQLQIFMTAADEAAFSVQVKLKHPRVVFIDPATWGTRSVPVTRSSIDACDGSFVLMLDESLTTIEAYGKEMFGPHPSGVGYSGAMAGPGLIIVSRSRVPAYDPNGLASGRIAAGYDSSAEGMDALVKSVMKIVKKGSTKVCTIDPTTASPLDQGAPGYVAWPDAVHAYDGSHGRYLRPDAIHRMVGCGVVLATE